MVSSGRPQGTTKNSWKYLSEKQLVSFFNQVRKEGDLRDDVMMSLTLYLGLRVQELVNLKIKDIEPESREITIQGMKSGRKRSYPDIDEKLWKKLCRWIKRLVPDEEFLFPSPKKIDGPISAQAAKDLFKKYASKEGLSSDFSIHSLRHTCAMLKAKNNESPIKIMLWLRHRSVMSTQRYFEIVALENEAVDASRVFGGFM